MRNFVNYVIKSYSGGQNDTDRPDQIREDQAEVVKNAYLHERGSLIKRSGISLVGNDTGNYAVDGLTSWTNPSGTKYFLRMCNGHFQYLNSGEWTSIDTGFTAGLPTEFVPAAGKLYIFNGTDNTHSWDGAAVTQNSALVDMGDAIPTGKYAVYWKNYMFVWGNVKISSTTYPGTCYFSNLGDPDTFTTVSDYFHVSNKDGQEDTAIRALDKFLIFGKSKSIHIVSGSNPGEWILSSSVNNQQILENSIGIASHRSMTQVGDDYWYMGSDGLIRSIRRNENGETPLSGIVCGNVLGTLSGVNKSYLTKVAAMTYDGRVYYAIPNGTATYNNLVLVAETRVRLDNADNPHPWVTYTGWQPACWSVYTPSSIPQLYFGNASADSVVFQAETGAADVSCVGTLEFSGQIDYDYKGPMIDLGQPEMRKTHRFLIVRGESGGNYDVEVSTSIDGNTFLDHGDLNLNAGSLWNTGVWNNATWSFENEVKEKFAIARASDQIQVRFRNYQASEPVTMYPYTLAIKPKKIK
jgi:hypothetical protein